MRGIIGNAVPKYNISSYRYFEPNEKHVTRICEDDVIVMIFSGVLRFSENGVLKEVSAGEYYIQEKGMLQVGEVESSSPIYYYIHFLGEFADNSNVFLKNRGEFDRSAIQPFIDQIETCKLNSDSLVQLYSSFYVLLDALAKGKKSEKVGKAEKIARYVSENIKQDISLKQLSERFGYCKNHIIKLFETDFGVTPHEYVILKRIDLAKSLLISSDASMIEIVDECGFGNYINFYKAFVKREGKSPGDFRKKFR